MARKRKFALEFLGILSSCEFRCMKYWRFAAILVLFTASKATIKLYYYY